MRVHYPFPSKASRKALVSAEDDHARRTLQEALSRAGFASETCSDVRMILDPERTAGHAFVILSDGAAGLETMRRLRKEGAAIPAILLSGGPKQANDIEVAAVEHLSTPFTLQTLKQAIARVCPALK